MSKVRLIQFIADSSRTGAPVHVFNILKNYDRTKFEIALLSPKGWLADEAKKLDVTHYELNATRPYHYARLAKAKDLIKNFNPDLIHIHGFRAGFVAFYLLNNFKIKKIYTEHLYTSDFHLKNKFRERMQRNFLGKLLRFVDLVICPSAAVKSFLEKISHNETEIVIVPNGIEIPNLNSSLPQPGLFGFIGSLNENKGIMNLVEAMPKIIKTNSEARLQIIGSGELMNEIREKTSGDASIQIIESVDNIYRHLINWNFIVVPSYSESFGQVVLDAASLRRPAIANGKGALPEVVLDEQTGLILSSNDPGQISSAVVKLLNNPSLTVKLGKKAYENFIQKYTAAVMYQNLEEIYLKVVKHDK